MVWGEVGGCGGWGGGGGGGGGVGREGSFCVSLWELNVPQSVTQKPAPILALLVVNKISKNNNTKWKTSKCA